MNRKRIILLCFCFTLFLLAGWQKEPSSPERPSVGKNSTNNSMIVKPPLRYNNCDDPVYMDLPSTSRYVISEKRLDLTIIGKNPNYDRIVEERVYTIRNIYDDKTRKCRGPLIILVYDSITGEPIPEANFETDFTNEEYLSELRAFSFDGMLIITTNKRVIFYDIEGDNLGTKLGELRILMPFNKIIERICL